MKRKKIIKKFRLLLLLIVSSFFFLSSTYAAIDTSMWNVYKNLEYGFELKYPETWVESPGAIPSMFLFGGSGWGNREMVAVDVSDIADMRKEYPADWIITKIFIDGIEATRYENQGPLGASEIEKGPFEEFKIIKIVIEQKGKAYSLYMAANYDVVNRIQFFEEMVFSFKFTVVTP